MGRVRLKKRFECKHYGFGKYCHACKDAKAGKVVLKKEKDDKEQKKVEGEKKFWKRAKCPYCNGSRVKHNEINAMSPDNMKEFTCTSWECGKSFNIDNVKEFDTVEVRPRVSRTDDDRPGPAPAPTSAPAATPKSE